MIIILSEFVGDGVRKVDTYEGKEVEPHAGEDRLEDNIDDAGGSITPTPLAEVEFDVLGFFLHEFLLDDCIFFRLSAGLGVVCRLVGNMDSTVFNLFVFRIVELVSIEHATCISRSSDSDLHQFFDRYDILGFVFVCRTNEVGLSIADELANGLARYCHEEGIIEFGENDQSQEVHDDIHDSAVCVQDSHVDDLDTDDDSHLHEADHECGEPIPELPGVVHGKLHHHETLGDLVVERNVQEDGA